MSYFEDYVEDGLCCEICGEFLGGDEPGFVRRCAGCQEPPKNRGRKRELDGQSSLPRFNRYSIPPREGTVDCPYCAAHPKLNGLADHIKAKHSEKIRPASDACPLGVTGKPVPAIDAGRDKGGEE